MNTIDEAGEDFVPEGKVIGPISFPDWRAMRGLRSEIVLRSRQKPTKVGAMFMWRAQHRYGKLLEKYTPDNPLVHEFILE